MKHIVVARHGDYLVDGKMDPLTELGKSQSERLARKLQDKLTGTFYFAASMHFRAAQTIKIISDIISPQELDRIPELYLGEGQEDCLKIDDRIKYQVAENIVLIGHQPMIVIYSNYLAKTRLNHGLNLVSIDEGQAVYFNLETKTVELLSD